MKSRMWPAVVGALLCVRLGGAQSVEMSTKPFTLSFASEMDSRIWVKWTVRQDADVVLQVVDADGKLIRTVDARHMTAGNYHAFFDGRDSSGKVLRGGEYLLRLNAGFKPEADMSFGVNGMLGSVTRKFTFKGDRKFDLGVKGFDAQTAKVKVDGESWQRGADFAIAGDNFRADGATGTIEFNPKAAFNKGAEIVVTVACGLPLENPWAVKTAADGSLYIADNLCASHVLNNLPRPPEGFVYKVDAAGKPVTDFGANGALATGCRDLAVDADGNLYVLGLDSSADVYDATGERKYGVAGWIDPYRSGDHSKGPEGGYLPQGIALNESNCLFMVNGNQSVVVFDATKPDLTGYLGIMDAKHGAQLPPAYGTFLGPCAAATGDFFYQTAGWSNLYKYRFDRTNGEFSIIWNTPVSGPGVKLQGPENLWNGLGIELDHRGLIYVADRENHRIQVFFDLGSSCKHAGSFGSAGEDVTQCQMMAPHAICLSPDGQFLYVADDGYFIRDSYFKAGEYAGIRGLARVTRMKLGFEETVETKLTVE